MELSRVKGNYTKKRKIKKIHMLSNNKRVIKKKLKYVIIKQKKTEKPL